jgi:hypothetical protein
MKSDRIADALGASHTIELPPRPAQGPLGLLQLRAEVACRLQSSGGRPTDPDWSLRRVVPFKPAKWAELVDLAGRLSQHGRTVSPAQLAALLIEQGLAHIDVNDEKLLQNLGDTKMRAS